MLPCSGSRHSIASAPLAVLSVLDSATVVRAGCRRFPVLDRGERFRAAHAFDPDQPVDPVAVLVAAEAVPVIRVNLQRRRRVFVERARRSCRRRSTAARRSRAAARCSDRDRRERRHRLRLRRRRLLPRHLRRNDDGARVVEIAVEHRLDDGVSRRAAAVAALPVLPDSNARPGPCRLTAVLPPTAPALRRAVGIPRG